MELGAQMEVIRPAAASDRLGPDLIERRERRERPLIEVEDLELDRVLSHKPEDHAPAVRVLVIRTDVEVEGRCP